MMPNKDDSLGIRYFIKTKFQTRYIVINNGWTEALRKDGIVADEAPYLLFAHEDFLRDMYPRVRYYRSRTRSHRGKVARRSRLRL